MPDPKKDKPKEKSSGWNFDPFEGIVILLFLLTVFGAIVPGIIKYVFSGELSFFGYKLSGFIDFFKNNVWLFKFFGFAFAGGAAIGTFSFTKMGDAIWRAEKAKLYPENMTSISSSVEPSKNKMLERWEKIVANSESTNQSDWRLAIIEADIILDELLEKLQLPGETMGDKLKAVEKSDFVTIDEAWEVHKFRNMIAHEGSNFLVNQREIRRIISLYEAVFKEFSII